MWCFKLFQKTTGKVGSSSLELHWCGGSFRPCWHIAGYFENRRYFSAVCLVIHTSRFLKTPNKMEICGYLRIRVTLWTVVTRDLRILGQFIHQSAIGSRSHCHITPAWTTLLLLYLFHLTTVRARFTCSRSFTLSFYVTSKKSNLDF